MKTIFAFEIKFKNNRHVVPISIERNAIIFAVPKMHKIIALIKLPHVILIIFQIYSKIIIIIFKVLWFKKFSWNFIINTFYNDYSILKVKIKNLF